MGNDDAQFNCVPSASPPALKGFETELVTGRPFGQLPSQRLTARSEGV